MSGKRLANSPAERIPENKKVSMPRPILPSQSQAQAQVQAQVQEPDPSKGAVIKFEVTGINDKQFFGTLSEPEILYIWEKILGRDKHEIFGMSYSRSLTRNFRVTFKLTVPDISPVDIYPEPIFPYQRARQDNEEEVDVLTCKFVGYLNARPAELGRLTRITIKTQDFAVDFKEIVAWLSKFGSVSANHDFERNSLGIRTDVLETEIVLAKHVPEYLPIAGRKVLVNYPGMPRACNNCYLVGHLKRNCKGKKKDWLDRVKDLRDSGDFEDSMFGGWIAILEQRFA
jgi:hypothetical protein